MVMDSFEAGSEILKLPAHGYQNLEGYTLVSTLFRAHKFFHTKKLIDNKISSEYRILFNRSLYQNRFLSAVSTRVVHIIHCGTSNLRFHNFTILTIFSVVSDDGTTYRDGIQVLVLQYSSNSGYSSNKWPAGAVQLSKSKWDGLLTVIIALYVYSIICHAQVKSCNSSNEKKTIWLSIIHICKIYP